jgi:hypothetical protein
MIEGVHMSSAGIVCIIFGFLIVIYCGLIVVAPAITLRWNKDMISTETRVRTLGLYALVLPALLIWAGASEDSGLANVLLIIGLFYLLVAIPWLVFFPRSYMEFANPLLPSNLMVWRVLGLLSAIVGLVLVRIGLSAL